MKTSTSNRQVELNFKYLLILSVPSFFVNSFLLHRKKRLTCLLILAETGKLMARYCIAFDTMNLFSKVTGTENLSDLVGLLKGNSNYLNVVYKAIAFR